MTDEPEILFEELGRAGLITLSRPRALNALTLSMIRKIYSRLLAWANDRRIDRVVIRGSGERAFCAGGDIRQLRQWGLAGDANALAFYREEYQLNSLIKHFPKPYVALVDGIVMGGGVGVSVHGTHLLCGERTIFSMPETAIGFFPDVGSTFFLPRLPGNLGTYLALTGARLGQADLEWCGLASHSIGSDAIDRLMGDLADGTDLDEVLARHAQPPKKSTLSSLAPVIDRCFGADSVQAISALLKRETGEYAKWAAETDAQLHTKSPISLHIALRQMRNGVEIDFDECMQVEFRIVNRVLKGADFYEGVRALIIDKDNQPQWDHRNLEAVTQAEIDSYFETLGAAELRLI